MADTGKKRTRSLILLLALLAFSVYGAVGALWGLYQTAVYVHETSVATAPVTNFTTKPFDSTLDAWRSGNFSQSGDLAYYPIITLNYKDIPLQWPDNEPCQLQDNIEVRIYPQDLEKGATPKDVRPNKPALLWGGNTAELLFFLSIGALAWWRLHSRRPKVAKQGKVAKSAPSAKKAAPKQRRKATPAKKQPTEPPFTLTAEPAPQKRKRSPRKKTTN